MTRHFAAVCAAALGAILFHAAAARVADAAPTPEHRVLAADYSKKRIALFDEGNKLVWEHPITDIHDLHLLENGNILAQEGWTKVVEIAPDHKIVWSYDSAKMNGNEGKRVEVHAFQRLEGGLTMIAESGPARIIEVDADGKIHHQFKMKVENPDSHRDTRLARKIANGNYLVCHEGDGAVREYEPSGNVVWEYKLGGSGGAFDHKGSGTAVFGAIRKPDGNTLIATGNGHSVIEVTPKGETVWSLVNGDIKGVKLAWVTTLELLPNGNLVIGNCHAGPHEPQILEVTREKKMVWGFLNFESLGDATSNSLLVDMRGKSIR